MTNEVTYSHMLVSNHPIGFISIIISRMTVRSDNISHKVILSQLSSRYDMNSYLYSTTSFNETNASNKKNIIESNFKRKSLDITFTSHTPRFAQSLST